MSAGFEQFFGAIHGQEPFAWQAMLAERVLESGWPSVVDLPTASGKTAVIDVAVYALARGAPRTQPRRIFFVIDRRIVVDEAFARAERIANRLDQAAGDEADLLHDIALRLLACGGERPLEVAVLRGGLYRDHRWARSPSQPLVCVSTVDQIGSRLLFRGYGLRTRDGNQFPIHAGLVGNDALVILDEAHLSAPFEETLRAVARYRGWSQNAVETPWQVVTMSATPCAEAADSFPGAAERESALADPVLECRHRASKPATLTSPVAGSFGAALAGEARRIARQDRSARVVAVVANRVATARETFDELEGHGERVLLIGRSRPVDRARLLQRWLPAIRAGRERAQDAPLTFVVATQCIEVGADLDFDALVTEVAPLDSLRQRFGRLDRLGERGRSRASILVRKESVAAKAVDHVYGTSLVSTWRWLQNQARAGGGDKTIDFGVHAIDVAIPAGRELEPLLAPRNRAPVLLPAYLDRLAQTSPLPAVEPSPVLFLHGPRAEPPEVQVVWRADLGEDEASWPAVVTLAPPIAGEVVQVPLAAVRRWLADERAEAADVADVEGASAAEDSNAQGGVRVLRWRGPTDSGTAVIESSEVRSGDTIVVPARLGGADIHGWNPSSPNPVEDVAEEALVLAKRRLVLRLHPAVIGQHISHEAAAEAESLIRAVLERIESGEDPKGEVTPLLELVAVEAEDDVGSVASRLLDDARRRWSDLRRRAVPYPDGTGLVLVASRAPSEVDDVTDEDVAPTLARPVSLHDHTDGVTARVSVFARSCGLNEALAQDLELAARLHDLGKVDERFQLMLHRGDRVAASAADAPLAKSGMSPRDRASFQRIRALSGYPEGCRHEAASVTLVESAPAVLGQAHDSELVLHLVASHHGHARPLLPPLSDVHPVQLLADYNGARLAASSAHTLAQLDSGVVDRFSSCSRRYGWWGLALLEAILRLADQRQSEEEARDA